MKKILLLLFLGISIVSVGQKHAYKVAKTFHIKSAGGWDYIAVNNNKIYVSHSTQVNILDENSGDSIGVILNTNGVHGIAFDNSTNKGYTSNGRSNNVTVFDLKTNQASGEIPTGENPDAIMYEPYSKTIITCNGRSKNLSVIDVKTNKVIKTIDIGGKPETAVSDGNGKVFVNIEDKNEIVEVNMKTKAVAKRWSIKPADGPTGLEYDPKTKRLFAACDKMLVVLNAENGTVVAKLPIGDGCDGVAFNDKNHVIYTSNGEGTMTAIKENSANSYTVLGNYATKKGARTITIDKKNGRLFLPTADFESPAPTTGRPKMIAGSFQVLVVE
ncbi:MAG TPA: YncE family protein [Flavisolibacter sp.]|nr:YncE family protein [Flavisolibacter sp.]